MQDEIIIKRRAIESLRSGVPTRDVVRYLPPKQDKVEQAYRNLLKETTDSWTNEKQPKGLIISGDFGTGKSHWLEYFRHLALENNFVCSRITINKETPLFDAVKLSRTCVYSARVSGKIGPALDEIVFTYDRNKASHYHELTSWIEKNPDLDPRLPASLYLFEKNSSSECYEKLIYEWSGYPMKVSDLRKFLKEIGERSYKISKSAPLKERIFHYFEFLSRFFYSRGYNGWILLIDETEMISKYSLRQRAKSYANIARFLGEIKEVNIPGLATVFTITPDYLTAVIYGKGDKLKIKGKLRDTNDEAIIPIAETGMKIIEKKPINLEHPNKERLEEIYKTIKAIYEEVYNKIPSDDIFNLIEYGSAKRTRQIIRSWINIWDCYRIYGIKKIPLEINEEIIGPTLEEDTDWQTESSDNDENLNDA